MSVGVWILIRTHCVFERNIMVSSKNQLDQSFCFDERPNTRREIVTETRTSTKTKNDNRYRHDYGGQWGLSLPNEMR